MSKHKTIETMGFFWSTGNSKVDVPIVNLETATHCSSAKACPYSPFNYKTGQGMIKCYAWAGEQRFPATMIKRQSNKDLLKGLTPWYRQDLALKVGTAIVEYSKKKGLKYCRLSESGDMNKQNIAFVVALSETLRESGITLYTYTHAGKEVKEQAITAGVVVVESDKDFVVVKDKAEAKKKGLKVCPMASCGVKCKRCPKGLKTAVVAH